jgi:hypothetical protein
MEPCSGPRWLLSAQEARRTRWCTSGTSGTCVAQVQATAGRTTYDIANAGLRSLGSRRKGVTRRLWRNRSPKRGGGVRK